MFRGVECLVCSAEGGKARERVAKKLPLRDRQTIHPAGVHEAAAKSSVKLGNGHAKSRCRECGSGECEHHTVGGQTHLSHRNFQV
jgi:prophage DNA circulation protein